VSGNQLKYKVHFSNFVSLLVAMLIISPYGECKAQGTRVNDPDVGGWYIVNAKVEHNKKVNSFFEIQARAWNPNKSFFYHEVKGGIGYKLKESVQTFLGIGRYATYANNTDANFKKPALFQELRLWQQVNLSNDIGRVKIEHRYRIEQRFFDGGRYRNRFRYRINAVVPLNHYFLEEKTIFGIVSNEVFFNNNEDPLFERNRFFAGIGYEITPLITTNAGWLSQIDYSKTNQLSKHYFQLAVLLSFRKKGSTKILHPSSED